MRAKNCMLTKKTISGTVYGTEVYSSPQRKDGLQIQVSIVNQGVHNATPLSNEGFALLLEEVAAKLKGKTKQPTEKSS